MIPPLSHNNTTLVLRRTFTATRLRVFRAWIEPGAVASWLRLRRRSVTVRSRDAGGGGSCRFEIEDGGSIVGTYLHIVPPEKLVFTWSGEALQGRETVVTLDFLDQGPVTEVVLTHEGLSTPDLRTLFGSGWPSLLDALSSVLSTHLNDDALSS